MQDVITRHFRPYFWPQEFKIIVTSGQPIEVNLQIDEPHDLTKEEVVAIFAAAYREIERILGEG
jgi:hypothetical protein